MDAQRKAARAAQRIDAHTELAQAVHQILNWATRHGLVADEAARMLVDEHGFSNDLAVKLTDKLTMNAIVSYRKSVVPFSVTAEESPASISASRASIPSGCATRW